MFNKMPKRVGFLLIFGFVWQLAANAIAQQQSEQDVRYITDELITYMHAGPGRNYRILGSLIAGTEVTQLQIDAEAGFVEIIDDRQRTGWVLAEVVTESKSLREQLPELQDRIEFANKQLTEQIEINENLNQQLSEVSTRSSQLNSELQELQKANAQLRQEAAKRDQSAQMQWFLRGGGIALAGIVLGVLLTFLPKRKRRNDQWM